MQDVSKKTQQTIWQDVLDYGRIVCDIAHNFFDKATNCNDMLGLVHQKHPIYILHKIIMGAFDMTFILSHLFLIKLKGWHNFVC